MKVEVDVLGSPSVILIIVRMGSVDLNKLCTNHSELRGSVKVEVDVLGSPSLIWSPDVKQH